MIAQTLKERSLFASMRRKLDQRLQEPLEKLLAPKPVAIEILIHLLKIAPPPKMHEAMHPVNQRNLLAARRLIAQRTPLALRPSLQPHLAAGVLLRIRISLAVSTLLFIHKLVSRPAFCKCDDVPGASQLSVRNTARNRVQNTGTRWGLVHAEVVPVKEVVGSRLVESIGHGLIHTRRPVT